MDHALVLAGAAENLFPARMQMALSLGWHIVFSCFGIAFPTIVVFTEWRAHRRGNPILLDLARTWAKAMGVLFAAGAVSGTLLSFEMGILWPGLMAPFGEVYGFPFVLEGFAFFLEAIFVGIYLFGWDRMSPRAHMLSALPIAVSGIAGAFFVIAANAWMNNPTGFRLVNGRVVDADPVGAMFGPSTWPQFVHMLVAAYMVTGYLIASVYAVGMLRGRRDLYHRFGLIIPLTIAAIATPIQLIVGDWIAGAVAVNQPVKLAAMEGLFHTGTAVPLSVGGIYIDDELRWALEIPWGLSFLVTHDFNGRVIGLESVPPDLRPPVNVVHLAYNTMVGIGSALALLALWPGLVVVAPPPGAADGVVPARGRHLRRGRGARDGDRVDHHRGRSPAVHRLRHPAHGRRREPGTWHPARVPGRIDHVRRADGADRLRPAAFGPLAQRRGAAGARNRVVVSLAEVVLGIMFVGLVAYALFAGADFGAGIWDLLAGGTRGGARPRAVIEHAIGPVWEANHVWLIFVLVVLWTGFPAGFTPVASTLYAPLTIAAFGMIARGAAFAFRKSITTLPMRRLLGAAFAVSSLVTPYFLGTVVGGVASGRVPPGIASRQRRDELGQPDLDARRGARRAGLRLSRRGVPVPRTPCARASRTSPTGSASGRWAPRR